MEDQFKEALEIAKTLARVMIEDKDFVKLQAEASKSQLDAYVEAGFSREEAIQLVAALTSKPSN